MNVALFFIRSLSLSIHVGNELEEPIEYVTQISNIC